MCVIIIKQSDSDIPLTRTVSSKFQLYSEALILTYMDSFYTGGDSRRGYHPLCNPENPQFGINLLNSLHS